MMSTCGSKKSTASIEAMYDESWGRVPDMEIASASNQSVDIMHVQTQVDVHEAAPLKVDQLDVTWPCLREETLSPAENVAQKLDIDGVKVSGATSEMAQSVCESGLSKVPLLAHAAVPKQSLVAWMQSAEAENQMHTHVEFPHTCMSSLAPPPGISTQHSMSKVVPCASDLQKVVPAEASDTHGVESSEVSIEDIALQPDAKIADGGAESLPFLVKSAGTEAGSAMETTDLRKAVEFLAAELSEAFAGLSEDRCNLDSGRNAVPGSQMLVLSPGTGGTDEGSETARLARSCKENAQRVFELSRALHHCQAEEGQVGSTDSSSSDLQRSIECELSAIMNYWGGLAPLLTGTGAMHDEDSTCDAHI
jgi:hypothetical protein